MCAARDARAAALPRRRRPRNTVIKRPPRGDVAAALAADREAALALVPVSRETLARLDRFVATFLTWQNRINLVAAATIPEIWTRHITDSLQLVLLAPTARVWLDLGAGGGFPGL